MVEGEDCGKGLQILPPLLIGGDGDSIRRCFPRACLALVVAALRIAGEDNDTCEEQCSGEEET